MGGWEVSESAWKCKYCSIKLSCLSPKFTQGQVLRAVNWLVTFAIWCKGLFKTLSYQLSYLKCHWSKVWAKRVSPHFLFLVSFSCISLYFPLYWFYFSFIFCQQVTVQNPENQGYLIAYKDSQLIVSSARWARYTLELLLTGHYWRTHTETLTIITTIHSVTFVLFVTLPYPSY